MNKFQQSVLRVLNKRDLSDNTIENYYVKLNKIRSEINPNAITLDFLQDTKSVSEYILKQNKTATQKALYIAIYSTIKNSRRFKKETKQFYKEQMEKYRDINNDERLDNIMIDSESERWIDAKSLVDIPLTLKLLIEQEFETLWLSESKFKRLNKRLKQKYLNMILDYVILFLHTQREPLRLDYATLPIAFNLKNAAALDYNILVIDGDNMILYLNNFKNIKKLGKQEQAFDEKMIEVVNKWFELLRWMDIEPKFLLYNVKGGLILEPFTSKNTFGQRLTSTFKKYSGKRISITLLRRIYETSLIQSDEYKQMTNRQKAEKHKKLLHGVNVAQEYNRIVL